MFKAVIKTVVAPMLMVCSSAFLQAGVLPVPSGPDSPQAWEDHYNGFASIQTSGSNYLLDSIQSLTSDHIGLGSPTTLPTPFNVNNPGFGNIASPQANGQYVAVELTTGLQVIAVDVLSGSTYTRETGTNIGTALGSLSAGDIVYFGAQSGATPHLSIYDATGLNSTLLVKNTSLTQGWSNNGNTFTGTDTNGNSFSVGQGGTASLAAQFTFADLSGLEVDGIPGSPYAPTGTLAATYINNSGVGTPIATSVVLSSDGLGSEANSLYQNGVTATYNNSSGGSTTLTGTLVSNVSGVLNGTNGVQVNLSDPLEFVTVSPEPSSFILFGIGGLAFAAYRRRQTAKAAA